MANRELRIVFLGTPEFAVPSLQVLLENNYDVVGVVTAPDKPAGRGKLLRESPIKKVSQAHGLSILQPTNLKDPKFVSSLQDLEANLFVIVAFRMLPEVVWAMPEFGTFNLHASLLPNYRGAAPINWAIINGEAETGVTTFFLAHEIDTGPIIHQEPVRIDEAMNAGSLHDLLSVKGADLVLRTVQDIELDRVNPQDQQHVDGAKAAPKIFREDCEIDWQRTRDTLNNFIRGLAPYPGAWTTLSNGETLKIFRASEIETSSIDAGALASDEGRFIAGCSDGALELHEVQLAGKKKMTGLEFLRGNPTL